MKMTVLVDNNAACGLKAEWGLSIYIEHDGWKILLDTGASGLFAANAEKLAIDLRSVDFGVLSHAHYDHGDGLDTFFEINGSAPFYLSADASENCYSLETGKNSENYGKITYDGIKRGVLEQYRNRIVYAGSVFYEICSGVYLLGHTTPGLEKIGERVGQFVAAGDSYRPDNFSHEQSLVIRTDKGLVVFNSCCHAGVDNIIKEVREAFPDETVHSIIGGFHMYPFDEVEVNAQAARIRSCGIRHIVTGHCTGDKQYEWLKAALTENIDIKVEKLCCGLQIEI